MRKLLNRLITKHFPALPGSTALKTKALMRKIQQFLPEKFIDRFLKIGTQLYLALGFIVTITLISSLFSWQSFRRIAETQSFVNETSIPALVGAFAIAQRSTALINAAPRLAAAATRTDLKQVVSAIHTERDLFSGQLDALLGNPDKGPGSRVHFAQIQSKGDALISNIETIHDSVSLQFTLRDIAEKMQHDLLALQANMTQILVPAIDDQLYFIVTGYRELGQPPAEEALHRSEEELLRYRNLADFQEAVNLGVTVLINTFNVSTIPFLEPQKERFEAVSDAIQRSRNALDQSPLLETVDAKLGRFFEIGDGDNNIFKLRTRQIEVAAQQADSVKGNLFLALELVSEVEKIVESARIGATQANQISEAAVVTGSRTLLALSVLSIVGAVLVGWLFVGKLLIDRLEWLAVRMRQMADGDLTEEVVLPGRDEVADMASALEIFRQNSLEALRVDVAEKLANEVSSKNAELEHVLGALRKAQNQIVMREKLAALGELTAGVAHEIKNPLNFIKNFSEVSIELIDELGELEEANKDPSVTAEALAENKGLIEEINADMKSNAERIKHHSERANRIVHDMLLMGRGGGERQPTDINAMLDEHVRLAFHSARASDPEFQLHIVQDLDPEMKEVEVIPQDLGRLFLNLIGNACYAANSQRCLFAEQQTAAGGGEGKAGAAGKKEDAHALTLDYQPTLHVTSKMFEDHFTVAIKDNGTGISEENISKIFNPFFTTKPTDKGTGLGLALSSDIIRAHGGSMDVKSEVGKFTEMTVSIPLTPPKVEPGPAEGDEHSVQA